VSIEYNASSESQSHTYKIQKNTGASTLICHGPNSTQNMTVILFSNPHSKVSHDHNLHFRLIFKLFQKNSWVKVKTCNFEAKRFRPKNHANMRENVINKFRPILNPR